MLFFWTFYFWKNPKKNPEHRFHKIKQNCFEHLIISNNYLKSPCSQMLSLKLIFDHQNDI